jgi:hypothetical protein
MFAATRRFRSGYEYFELFDFMGRFARYSPLNAFLLYLQNPTATYVATAGTWQKNFQRRPKFDARPLMILAPMAPLLFVYDLMDTEGRPVSVASLQRGGDWKASIYDRTVYNCSLHGIAVREAGEDRPRQGGAVRLTYETRRQYKRLELAVNDNYLILLNNKSKMDEKYAALTHALGHIFCGHLGIDSKAWWRERQGLDERLASIEAASVAFLVCRRRGPPSAGEGFLDGYARPNSYREVPVVGLSAILAAAQYIEEMGSRRWERPRRKSRYQ